MDFERLFEKKNRLNANKGKISAITLSSFEKDFELNFTHNSTAIEGNTLTLMETKALLEDGVSIGGKELCEIYEVVNHKKAYSYVKKCIAEGKELDERIVKDIHAILTENIIVGGIYRSEEVRISGAGFTPPSGNEMLYRIKDFYKSLSRNDLDDLTFASWVHAEFVRIHPFIDGNGRTSRLLLNYVLMSRGFLPVSVNKENRVDYYNALEAYGTKGELSPFADFISKLEEEQLDLYLKLL